MEFLKTGLKRSLISVSGRDQSIGLKEQIKIGLRNPGPGLPGYEGYTGLVTETSLLDARNRSKFPGLQHTGTKAQLPKPLEWSELCLKDYFTWCFIGDPTTEDEAEHVTDILQRRSHVPKYVFEAIDALPLSTHPMTMFVVVDAANRKLFPEKYAEGISKKDTGCRAVWWQHCIAFPACRVLPPISSVNIKRRRYSAHGLLDWQATLPICWEDESLELMRLYMTIHADHEGGNVSAHTTHLVGSALRILSFLCRGMNGLAGPLHGLANQEVIKWIFEMQHRISRTPTSLQKQIAGIR